MRRAGPRRWWALPLLPLWWAATGVKNWLYDAGWLRGKRLGWPVVCVGSLSAGGAGKTPVVRALAKLFADHGVECDVLSRGYGRGSGCVEEVDSGGDAARFGDEPMELARAGLRVFVGAERLAAGRLAEAEGGRRVHLLDDGFGHRQLWREVNVVLVTQADAEDWMLPAGNLREGFSQLRRAHVVVLREEEAEALYNSVKRRTRAKVWVVRRQLVRDAGGPRKPVAFCGVARPESFFAGLGALAGQVAFADHHAYDEADFAALAEAARRVGADGFVTTAKDAVKLTPAGRAVLEAIGPVEVVELQVLFENPERSWRQMRRMLGWADLDEAGVRK